MNHKQRFTPGLLRVYFGLLQFGTPSSLPTLNLKALKLRSNNLVLPPRVALDLEELLVTDVSTLVKKFVSEKLCATKLKDAVPSSEIKEKLSKIIHLTPARCGIMLKELGFSEPSKSGLGKYYSYQFPDKTKSSPVGWFIPGLHKTQ